MKNPKQIGALWDGVVTKEVAAKFRKPNPRTSIDRGITSISVAQRDMLTFAREHGYSIDPGDLIAVLGGGGGGRVVGGSIRAGTPSLTTTSDPRPLRLNQTTWTHHVTAIF